MRFKDIYLMEYEGGNPQFNFANDLKGISPGSISKELQDMYTKLTTPIKAIQEKIKLNNDKIDKLHKENSNTEDVNKKTNNRKQIEQLNIENKRLSNDSKKLRIERQRQINIEQQKRSKEREQKKSDKEKETVKKEPPKEEPKVNQPTKEPDKSGKPQMPNIKDVPITKLTDSDINQMVMYYQKLLNWYEKQPNVDKKGHANLNLAKTIENIKDEIKSFGDILIKRKNKSKGQ